MAVDTAYKRRAIRRCTRNILAPDGQIAGSDRVVLLGRYFLTPAAATEDSLSVTAWVSMNLLGDSAVHRGTSDTSALSMSLISDSKISRAAAAVSRLN